MLALTVRKSGARRCSSLSALFVRFAYVGAWKQRLIFLGVVLVAVAAPTGMLGAIVGEDVERDTPIVLDGEVIAIDQVGDTVIVGGTFTQVQTSRGGPVVDQPGLFAYDALTGAFDDDFRPVFSSDRDSVEITDIEPAPDGESVYVSGDFRRIDDGGVFFRDRIAKISLRTGLADRTFAQGSPSARPRTLSYSDGWLYVGGTFDSVTSRSNGVSTTHPVRGLARFDADTGRFDPSFLYRTETDIGPFFTAFREYGVSDLEVTADGASLVVAHRGAQIRDVARQTLTNAPGVAIIDLGDDPATHGVNGFRALYPDPNDPIQDFYHDRQCGGAGLQIQDIETSPDSSYFVVVGQGADSGFQCDTATRFDIGDSPARPAWVARAFDSILSVAVAEDAIYIGGHHRFMASPNAPSPYPGATLSNGEIPRFGEIYFADPEHDSPAAEAFRDDLFIPGYVYPVGQLGALDPDTGFGIPDWTPQSNALVGVLDLTLTDGGLLLGQDGDRVNDIFTGRAAFLSGTFVATPIVCSVDVTDDGYAALTWNDTHDVESFTIFQDGSQLDVTDQFSYLDTQTVNGVHTYEIAFVRFGENQTAACGEVDLGPVCIAPTPRDSILLIWNDEIDWRRITIGRDGRWGVNTGGAIDIDGAPATSLAQAARHVLFPDPIDPACVLSGFLNE